MGFAPIRKARLSTAHCQLYHTFCNVDITSGPAHLRTIDGDKALPRRLRERDRTTRVVTVDYWDVAPLLSASSLGQKLAETSTAIYAKFVPKTAIENQVRSLSETTTLACRFCPPRRLDKTPYGNSACLPVPKHSPETLDSTSSHLHYSGKGSVAEIPDNRGFWSAFEKTGMP